MPIREELESVLQAMHDAIDAGDFDAAQAGLAEPSVRPDPAHLERELAILRRAIPARPAELDFLHAEEMGTLAVYVYKISKPRRPPQLAYRTFVRRPGSWLMEGSWGASPLFKQDAAGVAEEVQGLVRVLRPKVRRRSRLYVLPEARPHHPVDRSAPLRFLEAYRVTRHYQSVAPEAVAAAETQLGLTFPFGYREYVCTFGEADYCTRVRVHPPGRIVEELAEWRESITRYYSWDAGARLLDFASLQQCVRIADTFHGDDVIFHPSDPTRLYALPRDERKIFEIGSDLDEALEWLCGSGKLQSALPLRYVDNPGPTSLELGCTGEAPTMADVKAQVLNLGMHAHVMEENTEDERALFIYVPGIGGCVWLVQANKPGADLHVHVDHDAEPDQATLRRLLVALGEVGLTH